jgi:hypothetical protein
MEMTLRMPSNYVEIARDEMEYVDGGDGFITFHVSKSVINAAIGVGASAAISAALAAAGFTGGLSTWVIPGLVGIVAACISNAYIKPAYLDIPLYFTGAEDFLLNWACGWDRQATLSM